MICLDVNQGQSVLIVNPDLRHIQEPNLQNIINRLSQRIGALESIIKNQIIESAESEKTIKANEAMIAEVKEIIAKMQEGLDNVTDRMGERDEDIDDLKEDIDDLKEKLGAVSTKIKSAATSVKVMRDKPFTVRDSRKDPFYSTPQKLNRKNPQTAVHKAMLTMLGLDPTKNANVQRANIPKPLEEGEAPRTTLDGTRLWHPNWLVSKRSKDGKYQVNEEFIDAAVQTIIANDNAKVSSI